MVKSFENCEKVTNFSVMFTDFIVEKLERCLLVGITWSKSINLETSEKVKLGL